ncbi:MAB_1171c family putative transporter [Streptomyces sp. NPDC087294]|uniref:MAB_1171c family putative transporter n=1 Tax=Streptomyces sp. NPDC087294 TaxID=3365777 RepID=UPI0037F21D6C
MNGLLNYVSCGALWLGLLAKIPDLLRHPHDPYLRAICAVLGLSGLCFFLGAVPTVAFVNDVSGVPNLAAPLTYASITAYGAAAQVLIVHWRGGVNVRRTVRRWIVAYACVVLGIAVMFALGDASAERRTDFDTYYATTPFLAEMIVLYLCGHLAATTVTMVSSLRWACQVGGWLRAGMVTLGVGTLCNAGYSVVKLAAVVARWFGERWSALVTDVSPAAAGVGALLTVVGIVIPLCGPRTTERCRARRTYWRLAPLERELDAILTRRALRLPRPRWASPATRLIWRQTGIHNGLGHLDALFDRALFDRVRARTLRESADPALADATAWATVIVTAVREEPDRVPPRDPDRLPTPPPDLTTLLRVADVLAGASAAHPGRVAEVRDPRASRHRVN